jgi:predicted component of type VI protein secretion system
MGYLTNEGLMKTTIEMPDDLYRAAKAEAALRGRKLKDLIEEGLRLVLASRRRPRRPSLAELTRHARGIVDSGIPDLGSNPAHLATFGRNARRDR